MHFRTAILSLLTASALASPTPRVNEDDDYPILHVTNFGAFVNDDPSMPSHVSFHVVDPRPDNFVETDCILYRAGSLFKTVWVNCENTSDVSFLFASDAMRLQRVFLLDPADNKTKTAGFTDWQLTSWSEATDDACGNATKTAAGTFYSRTTDWEFTIHTINP